MMREIPAEDSRRYIYDFAMCGCACTQVGSKGWGQRAVPIVMRGKTRVRAATDKKKGPSRSDRGPF